MNHHIATTSNDALHENVLVRIARSLVNEALREGRVASFRCPPTIITTSFAHRHEQSQLKKDLERRITELLKGQPRPLYKYEAIDLQEVDNTIRLSPLHQNYPPNRLEITLTVTRH